MRAPTFDAYGNLVSDLQRVFVHTALSGNQVYAANPNYASESRSTVSSEPAPQFKPSWDNIIGTPSYRTLGHAVMPIRIIWTSPITLVDPNDYLSAVVTFAGGISSPIDQSEEGFVTGFSMGGDVVYTKDGGLYVPEGMNPFLANAMQAAIDNMIVYPGSESQLPDPTIASYEGESAANAYRGLRYILVKDWPVGVPLKDLSIDWRRTNRLPPTRPPSPGKGRPPKRRRPSPEERERKRLATGDYSCYIAHSDDGGASWLNDGAEIFTPGGDIWAGAAGIDENGNQAVVMVGDGPNFGMEGVG